MKTVIILAMHGAPPNDFPRHEVAELFSLHNRLEHTRGAERAALEQRHAKLDAKMRAWPRTPQNDPFHAGSQDLAKHLSQAAGCAVIAGFNEFCAPSLDDALEQAVARGAKKVIVVTPMMTRGGEHSEIDIPAFVRRAQARYSEILIIYAWPFNISKVAQFLASQISELV
jgi:sirohydrochlorin cobaltochelatase